MKRITGALVSVLLSVALASCGANISPSNGGGGKVFSAAVVFSVGGLGDKSYYDGIQLGAEYAKENEHMNIMYITPRDKEDYESEFFALAREKKYDIIVAAAEEHSSALAKVAEVCSEQKFLILNAELDLPNVASVRFLEKESAFLAGCLAAMSSKIGSVGVLAADDEVGREIQSGFAKGAKYINPGIGVVSYSATLPFQESSGYVIAGEVYDKNIADIIYTSAGAASMGVFRAAGERGKYAIGSDINQNNVNGYVIASTTKSIDKVVYSKLVEAKNGNLDMGIAWVGLENDFISCTFEGSGVTLSDEIHKRLEEIEEKIVIGEIEI